jgi:phage-related tail fiber protein
MANTLRIKRRAAGSAAGAPASMANAELAFNEQDTTLYYGTGTGGAGGTATSVIAIGGNGAFVDKSSDQTVAGVKTFSSSPVVPTPGTSDSSTNAASTAYVKNQAYIIHNEVVTATGDATGATAGSGTNTLALTLANTAVTAGQYTKITVDGKGRATAGTTLVAADIPTLTAAKISDFDTQVRTNRLDQMAAPTGAVALNAQKITGLADPVAAQDAATKNYVDLTAQGLDPKQSVKAATTANLASMSGPLTVDGISLVAGDRVLVKDQTTTSANGVYVVASGAWTRTLDMDEWVHLPGAYLFVEQGTVNADMGYLCTVDQGGTLNTTAITFVQFNGAGQVVAGAGLTKTGNQLDVATASTARIVVNADNIDLATAGTAGTYQAVTTDAYGRVTSGTNPTTLTGYGITDAQALDATLTALAGVITTADKVIYATGIDTFTTADFPSAGRSLVAAVSAAAGRTVLGLGTIATQAASSVAITGGTIDGVTFDGGTF